MQVREGGERSCEGGLAMAEAAGVEVSGRRLAMIECEEGTIEAGHREFGLNRKRAGRQGGAGEEVGIWV